MSEKQMTLVFIYGPPAVGKTTVGRALSKLIGYRLFINHLTISVARAIFPQKQRGEPYFQLLGDLRLASITAAAKEKINLIFTLAYSGARDDEIVEKIVTGVENQGGKVQFVELYAPPEVLLNRVGNESRKVLEKLNSSERLLELLKTRNLTSSVNYPNVLRINTSNLSPEEAAQQIAATL